MTESIDFMIFASCIVFLFLPLSCLLHEPFITPSSQTLSRFRLLDQCPHTAPLSLADTHFAGREP